MKTLQMIQGRLYLKTCNVLLIINIMNTNILLSIIIAFCILNLIISISVCNFLIKMAESINSFRKDLENIYLIQRKPEVTNKTNNQETGLVDL